MLSKTIKRGLSCVLYCLMLVSLLSVSAFAVSEAEMQEREAEEIIAAVMENPVVRDFQEQMDEMLKTYLGSSEVTAEEVPALAADLSEAMLSDAWWAIAILAEDMNYALEDGLMTETEGLVLVNSNPAVLAFSDYVMENAPETDDGSLYASSGSWTPVTGVTVSVSRATDCSHSSGTVTVTAKGSAGIAGFGASAKTATVTIKNSSDTAATVSFNWTAASVNQLVIDETTYSGTSGSFSKVMAAGAEIIATITTAKNSTVNKLVMSNFAWAEVQASSKVTFKYDSSLGSITVAGNAVTSGTKLDIEASGKAIVATAKSGAAFLGWVDGTGKIINKVASYTLIPEGDMTVQAVFAGTAATSSGWFLAGGDHLFSDLTTACAHAASAGTKTVVLMNNATLPAGNYTIPAGVTLLIPFDSSNTLCTTSPAKSTGNNGTLGSESANELVKPSAYRTLTMASGAKIEVNGAISVSGAQCSDQGANGSPTGPVGYIKMAESSSITINDGANLYAWGYITGSGSVTVKSGGTVYEDFQLRDWRGGTAASGMLRKDERVFPVSQYYVQNVEVPMVLEAGAEEYGAISMVVTLLGYQASTVPFIGEKGMFKVEGEGTITKDYIESTDRMQIDIDGDLSMKSLELKLGTTSMTSTEYVLPIANHLTVNVNSGTTTIGQDMCMLPGSEITVAEGATVQLAENVQFFIYDVDEWASKLFVYPSKDVAPLKYVSSGAPKTRAALADAKIVVDGTIDASKGFAYSTTSGASIVGTTTGGGKAIVGTPGTQTITYQATQSGTDISFVEVAITPAKLKNGDGTYTETAKVVGTATYKYVNGVWMCQHVEVIDAAVAATCTATGLTEGKHCSVCNTVIVAQEVVNALGHTAGAAADCENAQTCTVCGAELAAALGHEINTVTGACTHNCGLQYFALVDDEPVLKDSFNVNVEAETIHFYQTYDAKGIFDLNGRKITGEVPTATGFIDSATNAYDATNAGSIELTTAPAGVYSNGNKHYAAVALKDSAGNVTGYQFHRVGTSVTAARIDVVGEATYLSFEATFRGSTVTVDSTTISPVMDLFKDTEKNNMGFILNGTGTAIVNDKGVSVANPTPRTDSEGKALPGYELYIHYTMVPTVNSYTVQAQLIYGNDKTTPSTARTIDWQSELAKYYEGA